MSDEATDRATFEQLMESAQLDEHAEWQARSDYCRERGWHELQTVTTCRICRENFTTGAHDE